MLAERGLAREVPRRRPRGAPGAALPRQGGAAGRLPVRAPAVPLEECVRIHASSGTRGKPTIVALHASRPRASGRLHGPRARRRRRAAGRPRPRRLRLRPLHRRPRAPRRRRAHGPHGGARSGGNTPRQMLLLQDFGRMGSPARRRFALSHRRERCASRGGTRALGLRYGLFGAEPWTEAMRGQLEALWGCTALRLLRPREVIGPGVAAECVEARDGAARERGPLPARDRRPGDRRAAAGRATRASSC